MFDTKKIFQKFAVLALFGGTFAIAAPDAHADSIVVAGGCFWCVESDFEKLDGVTEAVSGYTGGTVANPTYKQVTRGGTGHYEAVKIDFDPAKISLDEILHKFLRSVDVTDAGGQFCDRGDSYRTAIFATPDQIAPAKRAISKAQSDLERAIVTPVLELDVFYMAEDYHQDYYKGQGFVLTRFGPKRQSEAYQLYRDACERDARVRQVWGDSSAFAK